MPYNPKHHKPKASRFAKKEYGERYDSTRPNSFERGYDTPWKKFRLAYLSEHPLCVECLKLYLFIPATDVDHIKPLRDRPDLKYELSNLQPLCHKHHSAKTAKGM